MCEAMINRENDGKDARPICPYCKAVMVKTYAQLEDDSGCYVGWRCEWRCECKHLYPEPKPKHLLNEEEAQQMLKDELDRADDDDVAQIIDDYRRLREEQSC